MRCCALWALVFAASACSRGNAIYAGSDVPIAGGAIVVQPEGPVSGRGEPEPPPNMPMMSPPMDSGSVALPDAAPARDASAMAPDASTAPGDAGAIESDAGMVAEPDAAMPSDAGPTCAAGLADCDGEPANGCEADTMNDPLHCGGCDRDCHADGAGVSASMCIAGSCRLTCQLAPIRGDCDGDPDNGCETDLWHDPDNCSVCGMHCNRCADGNCL